MPMLYVKKEHYDRLLRLGKEPAQFIDELLERHLKEVDKHE